MSQTSTAAPTVGRPKMFTPALAEYLATLISQTGLSDSAAAQQLGLSTSSLSRWKQQNPAFALALLQARETFRVAKLDLIIAASQTPGNGWRAAAWLLERIFPEDYHPNATQRAKHQELAAAREAETLAAAFPETNVSEIEEPSVTSPSEPHTAEVQAAPASATPSHNSQNSPRAVLHSDSAQPALELPEPAISPFMTDPSQNSQNPHPSILIDCILSAA